MTMENTPRKRGRPPKVHPGYGETREALVRAGVIALTQKGLPATAIDEILESVHVPKGSFYHYFQSKEAFGAELIKRYAEYFARRLDSFLLNDAHPPLDRLRAFTIDAEAAMERHAFTRGCLVGNLGQEMGSLPASYRQQLIDVLMAIGTAGFTAVLCILALERHGLKPADGPVLVTGAAGGVGSVAVTLLAAR